MLGIIESNFNNRLSIEFRCRGIYGIRHDDSNKIYIGSSKNVRIRLNQHFRALITKRHSSRHLQRAWNKYKQEAFTVILFEKVSADKILVEREQFWIDYFLAHKNGFNLSPQAASTLGVKWTEEQKNKIRGYRRGMWTPDSHKRVSEALKQFHAKNPEWRKNAQKWLHSPENEIKRLSAFRAALKRPEVYNARIQQLRLASKSPAKDIAVRNAYFKKFGRQSLGFQSPEEMDQACSKLYLEGKTCREIGKLFHIGHHAISDRLRRLGFSPSRIRHVGFPNPKEMIQACVKLYLEGKSCREIGRTFGMRHKAIVNRLKRAGINPIKSKSRKRVFISASTVETK